MADTEATELEQREGKGKGLRSRADGSVTILVVVLAIALLGLVAVLGFWLDIYYGAAPRFGSGIPASGPITVLFVLTFLSGIRFFASRLRLTRRQLLSMYSIILVGAPLVSTAVLANMLAHATIQRYMAARTLEWQESFIPLLPSWFGPTDWSAIQDFYVGLNSVPWGAWAIPLVAWCSFLMALVACSVCLVLLVQRQWITHERLSFPLAQIPLEMVSQSVAADSGKPRLPASSLFWVGLLLSLGMTSLNTVARHYPAVPAIPLGPVALMQWRQVGPAAGLGEIDLVLWPWLIAIAFLVPKELSFSCWFFWLVRVGLTVIGIATGSTARRPELWWSTEFPASVYQGVGALFAIGAWSAWAARRHLAHALRVAVSRRSGRDDAAEPIPYRWMLVGFAFSFAWLVFFCWLAGSRVWFGVVLILLILAYYMTWARLRAETGLGFLPFPFFPHEIIVVPFGSKIFRPREFVTLIAPHWAYFAGGGTLEVVPGNALEATKIADSANINTRKLLIASAVGFLLVLPLGVWITLSGIYHYGFYSLHAGQDRGILHWYSWYAHDYITRPRNPDLQGTAAVGAGAAVAVFLGLMRLRFWWWPLHPIGYLAAFTWGMHLYYMPFFVGWLAKTLTVRYGGLRLYRKLVPAAIGLVIGDLVHEVAWGFISLATGTRW